MTAPNPKTPTPNKGFDWAVTATGGLAIVLLGGALGLSYMPKVPSTLISGLRYGGFLFLVLFALGALYQNKDFFGELSRRQTTQAGANSLLRTVAILVILVALNYFGFRHHNRLDLTANHQFSLADQSKTVAKSLKEDIRLTAFIRGGDPQGRTLKDLMTEYGYVTDRLKLEIIDPDREPGKVQQFFEAHPTASKRSNVLMLERNGKMYEAQAIGEQDITSALIKATMTKSPKVYFLLGHGEPGIGAQDPDAVSQVKETLEKQNDDVQRLSLFETKVVPADCDLLVLAGARKALLPQELKAYDEYVARGGRSVILFAPGAATGLEKVTERWGVVLDNDLVIDPRSNMFGDLAVPVVQNYGVHKITDGLRPTIFPAARSLTILTKLPAGVQVAQLVDSSDQSFGKTNLQDRSPTMNPLSDRKGPLHLGVAITTEASGSQKASRTVVFGNSQFITNGFLQGAGNADLFLNCVNWVLEQDNLVSIPAKKDQPSPLYLTSQQTNTIFLATVAGAPGLMLLAGGLVWWRRRRS